MKANPIAIASMLMAWVYIGGPISGAHYNPMVSLAVAIRGRLSWHELPWYMLSQIFAGTIAYAFSFFLIGALVIPHPAAQVTILQAFIVELLLAFTLAFLILCVATSEKFKQSYIFGFAIGFVIPALAAIGAPTSGGLFNPAIALGATVFGIAQGIPPVWIDVVMYVGGALLGWTLAAYAFAYFIEDDRHIFQ